MMLIKHVILIILITMLVACGGGGSGETNPNPTPTPNTPPTLTISVESINIDENSVEDVSITFSDANGDNVSITATSSNANNLSVAYNSGTLTLTSGNIDSDKTETITVQASDGNGGSVSRTLTVNILNVNLPPVIEIGDNVNNYTLVEGTVIETSFVISDPEGESISLDISTTNSVLQITYIDTQAILRIEAGEVAQDENVQVTIIATDSSNMVSELVLDVLIQNFIVPPVIVLLDEEDTGLAPRYVMGESTRYAIPFRIDDSPLSLDELTFDIVAVQDGGREGGTPIEFQFNIDRENSLLEIVAGSTDDLFDHYYQIALGVSDGISNDIKQFELRVRETSLVLNLFLERDRFYITEGETVVLNYDVYTSNPDNIVIDGITYNDQADITAQPFNIVINEVDSTISFTANEVITDRNVRVFFNITDSIQGTSRGSSIDIGLKNNLSELETRLINRINEVQYFFQFSSEQEEIINYLADVFLVQNLYGVEDLGLGYELVLDIIDSLKLESRQKERDIASYLNYLSSLEGKLLDYFDPETPLVDRESIIQSELDNLDVYESIAKDLNWYSFLNIDSDNLLLATGLNIEFTNFDHEVMVELPNGKYSRYVGNLKYGSYATDGIWVFNDEYKYLLYPLTRYLEMEIR